MSETESGSDLPTLCPSCGAAVRRRVPWCLQCYASLRPEPDPPLETRAPGAHRADAARPAGSESAGAAEGEAADEVAVERLLAELATTSKPLPVWWSRLPTEGGAKIAWMAGAIAVAAVGLVLALTLVGVFI